MDTCKTESCRSRSVCRKNLEPRVASCVDSVHSGRSTLPYKTIHKTVTGCAPQGGGGGGGVRFLQNDSVGERSFQVKKS